MHHLQQILHFSWHGTEPIHEFRRQRLALRVRAQRADPPIQPQTPRQVAHITIRYQHRQPKIDIRRPVAILGPHTAFLRPHLGDASSSICW